MVRRTHFNPLLSPRPPCQNKAMRDALTPAAQRLVDQAHRRAQARSSPLTEPGDLLAALADQPESKAGELLADHGLRAEELLSALGFSVANSDGMGPNESVAEPNVVPGEPPRNAEAAGQPTNEPPDSLDFRAVLNEARSIARRWDRNHPVSSEHLLLALVEYSLPLRTLLVRAGVQVEALVEAIRTLIHEDIGPIEVEDEPFRLDLGDAADDHELARILDASGNRAREALRVIEDYVRFALDDPMLTRRLKDVRHRLSQALAGLDDQTLLAARDTPGDVGTHIMTPEERLREHPRAVLTANFKRLGEALRTLEEYCKIRNVWLSGRFEVLRYDVYTLEKMVATAIRSQRGLGKARLYLLVGGLPTLGDLTWVVGEALEGGVDVVQLREKGVEDRVWLERAREVRLLTARAGATFVVNDRCDLARLAGADGVHLGQTDLTVRDARRLLGGAPLIGVSTHDPSQIRHAVLDAANYLGVGPVFPSGTKSFDSSEIVGLGLVRHAAETTTLPWFALGGIDESNLDDVLEAGARRVAVSGALLRAGSPRKVARSLKDRLEQAVAISSDEED